MLFVSVNEDSIRFICLFVAIQNNFSYLFRNVHVICAYSIKS